MIGRIEYTSCEDGIDGIRGFQIRAITSGIAESLRAAALRDSVYEPPPAAPAMPDAEELFGFPVTFGYTPVPDGAALYQSTYVGRDHTGRWGNYFAQAVTVDAGEPRPDLPIDLWSSPLWRTKSDRSGDLDRVDPAELRPGGAAGVAPTTDFLNNGGRQRALVALVATVRGLLDNQRGRLVLIVEDSTAAALWVSALTRSLPPSLAWMLSFTTFTSRPESHSALLAFTTPDVSVPAYGNYRTLDLRLGSDFEADISDYDEVVVQLWMTEGPGRLFQRASTLSPPLAVAELDDFAHGALLFEAHPAAIEWTEAKVLAGLRFVLRRMPETATQPWDKVAAAVREVSDLRDVVGWSEVLRDAVRRRAVVPVPLLQSYAAAAIHAVVEGRVAASVWLPSLDPTAQWELASSYLAPSLWQDPPEALTTWLLQPANRDLRETTLDVLAGYAEPPPTVEEAIESLTATAARAIYPLVATRPRLRLTADIVLAAAGEADPVEILVNLRPEALRRPEESERLGALLWPQDPPTAEQGLALLSALSIDQLERLALVDDHLTQRLLADCDRGLTDVDFRLAHEVSRLARKHPRLLSETNQPMVNLVNITGHLGGQRPYDETIELVRLGVDMRGRVAPALGDQFNGAAISWVLSLGWSQQRVALRDVVAQDAAGLSRRYVKEAEAELTIAKPERTAELLTAWRQLGAVSDPPDRQKDAPAMRLSEILLNEVLPRGLHRSSARYLERLKDFDLLKRHGSLPDDRFERWWAEWQRAHPRQSLLGRFRLPKLREDR